MCTIQVKSQSTLNAERTVVEFTSILMLSLSLWWESGVQEIPAQHRGDAVSSLVYEANARVRDPVYGCVGAISSLQEQVEALQAQLALAQAEMVRLRMTNDYIVHRLKAASRAGGGGSSYAGSPSSMSSPKTAEPEAHCKATPELLDMVVDQPGMDDAHFWSSY
jgi:hypothetical protein